MKREIVFLVFLGLIVSGYLAVFWSPFHETLHSLACTILNVPHIQFETAVWSFSFIGQDFIQAFPYYFSVVSLFSGVSFIILMEYSFNKKISFFTFYIICLTVLYLFIIYCCLLNEFNTNITIKLFLLHLEGLL